MCVLSTVAAVATAAVAAAKAIAVFLRVSYPQPSGTPSAMRAIDRNETASNSGR
jgi:hypothetical protein